MRADGRPRRFLESRGARMEAIADLGVFVNDVKSVDINVLRVFLINSNQSVTSFPNIPLSPVAVVTGRRLPGAAHLA